MELCQDLFFGGPLYTNCRALESTHLFYYESCLNDIAATGMLDAGNVSASMFAILCKETLDVPETAFYGFYTYGVYAPPKTFPWWYIVLIVVLSLLILVCLSYVIYRCHLRRKLRRKSDHDEDSGFELGERGSDSSVLPHSASQHVTVESASNARAVSTQSDPMRKNLMDSMSPDDNGDKGIENQGFQSPDIPSPSRQDPSHAFVFEAAEMEAEENL